MKPLYTKEQFENAKSNDTLPCECYQCKKIFFKKKNMLKLVLKNYINKQGKTYSNAAKYCSKFCQTKGQMTKELVNCKECNKEFFKKPAEIKSSKNNFCSRSCGVTYNNKNKESGNVRSKLEKWIEEQLLQLYPEFNILFNKKEIIGSELDIYIPKLNLAFELNGIFHYEPIFGVNKLEQIKNNDISKSKACIDNKIDLCIIDTSQQKYVKPATSQKYLDIINNIIKERLSVF